MKQLYALLDEYLDTRRSLGANLKETEWLVRQFLAFLGKRNMTVITTDSALRWALEPQNVSDCYRYRRLAEVRKFVKFAQATDARHQLPPPGLLTYRNHRRQPYIYTPEQIVAVMNAAGQLAGCLRPQSYTAILGLLSVTGMRSGEVVGLTRADVDLRHGLIAIRNSKFGKSRMVMCHLSTQQALRRYARQRDQLFNEAHCESFFLNDRGRPISQAMLQQTFVSLSRKAGLRKAGDSCAPRLHDMRHTYAVQTLMRFYRDGADVESRLPQLATWLGHAGIGHTYWYVSAVPELMQLAVQKLEQQCSGGGHGS